MNIVCCFILLAILGTVFSATTGRFNSTLYFNGSLLDESINEISVSGIVLDAAEFSLIGAPSTTEESITPSTTEESFTPSTTEEFFATPVVVASPDNATCSPFLINPIDRKFQIGCVPLFPDISYVPPGFYVGKVTVDRPGNWSVTQQNSSNFDVFPNGTITVGGFLLGDGFEGIIALTIEDFSNDTCDAITNVEFTVQVSCYPDRPTTTQPSIDSQSQTNLTSNSTETSPTLSPDLTDTSPISFQRMEFQIPAGVDLG